jgi:serine/threonine protein kinase
MAPIPFGDYLLTKPLGSGGMAELYCARRPGAAGFERTVVIKRIHAALIEDAQFVQMFINEAKIASRLVHPNIIQVYELGEVGGELFIAMEYVAGKDLTRLFRALYKKQQHTRLPPLVAAFIAREVFRGLLYAHTHRNELGEPTPIVHRDISPPNIMVSYEGQVKLVDFGIAKALNSIGELTRAGVFKGKLSYMAPELFNGGSAGPQTDIFSAGVVLHELLAGKRLFRGQTENETITKINSMPIPVPSQIVSTCPVELDAIVLKTLERDPAQRYESASTIVRQLDAVLHTHDFAEEDVRALMTETFPIDEREEVSDARSASGRFSVRENSPAGSTPVTPPDRISPSPSGSLRRPSVPMASGPEETQGSSQWMADIVVEGPENSGARVRRTRFITIGIAAAGLLTILVVVLELARPKPATTTPTPSPPQATVAESPTIATAPVLTEVLVTTEPPAKLYQGARLVGLTPTRVRVPIPGSTRITLVRSGYADLTQDILSTDGPELILRLTPSPARAPIAMSSVGGNSHRPIIRHHEQPARKPQVPGPRRPKIDLFDDSVPNSRPKMDVLPED